MNHNLSSAQLKSISRGQLLGKYGAAIAAEFVATGIMAAASLLCSALTDQTTTAGTILACLISFILEILGGIFLVGLSRFYRNLVCSRPYPVSDIFYGFRSHADKAIAIRFFLCAAQLLCMLPFLLCMFFYLQYESAMLFLCGSILAVIGGVIAVYITLVYSQVYYIMLDFPGFSVKQIMNTSKNIMKGNKGRLFYITVSLIPYYLAAFLSCGIALFWVTPYRKTIYTNFYLDLMHREYTV